MLDREKVMEQLERLSKWLDHQYQVVYDGDAPNYYDAYKAVDNAISLLKEQEPVEPKRGFVFTRKGWFCGSCGYRLNRTCGYCAKCGRSVKWDDSI